MRGHLDCATAILEIARLQYVPKEEVQERYTLANEEDDDFDSDDSDVCANPGNIVSTLVDDTFTIDDIGELPLRVQSRVDPQHLISWACPVSRFIDGEALLMNVSEINHHEPNVPNSLFSYAILVDDLKLLMYLIELSVSSQDSDANGTSRTMFAFPLSDLHYALQVGRVRHISEILKRTGAGIPLEDLVKKSGVGIKEKSKYYQGLTVKVSLFFLYP